MPFKLLYFSVYILKFFVILKQLMQSLSYNMCLALMCGLFCDAKLIPRRFLVDTVRSDHRLGKVRLKETHKKTLICMTCDMYSYFLCNTFSRKGITLTIVFNARNVDLVRHVPIWNINKIHCEGYHPRRIPREGCSIPRCRKVFKLSTFREPA